MNITEQEREGNVVTIDMFTHPSTPPRGTGPQQHGADIPSADDDTHTSTRPTQTSDNPLQHIPIGAAAQTNWDPGVYADTEDAGPVSAVPALDSNDTAQDPASTVEESGTATTTTPPSDEPSESSSESPQGIGSVAEEASPEAESTAYLPAPATTRELSVEDILRGSETQLPRLTSPEGTSARSNDSSPEPAPQTQDSYDSTQATSQQRQSRINSGAAVPPDPAEPGPAGDDHPAATSATHPPMVVRAVTVARNTGRWVSRPFSFILNRIPEGKRPLVKLAAVALVAVVLIVVVFPRLIGGGDQPRGDSTDTASPTTTAQTPIGADPNTQSTDGVIAVPRENVSADCANGSSSPALVLSTASHDAWRCMRYFSADGVTLEIRFSKPVTISQIQFVPGWNYVEPSVDNWTKWRVLKEVLWLVGEDQYPQSITPNRGGVTQRFNPPVSTTVLKMLVQRTEQASGSSSGNNLGGSWSTTEDGFAVSHMRIYGRDSQ